MEPVAAHDTPTEAAEAVSGNGSDASTDYASSDDGGFPFADEEHVDHYGTGALEGDSMAPLVETPLTAVACLLGLAGLSPGEKLLDVGCGDGRIAGAAGSSKPIARRCRNSALWYEGHRGRLWSSFVAESHRRRRAASPPTALRLYVTAEGDLPQASMEPTCCWW